MTPYAQNFVAIEDKLLLEKMRKLLDLLPDVNLEPAVDSRGRRAVISCHILSEALATVFPDLTCYHGYYFVRIYAHSWLVTGRRNLIDHYPIGTLGGPILIEGGAPSVNLYHESQVRNFETPEFKTHVTQITEVMRAILDAESWKMYFPSAN